MRPFDCFRLETVPCSPKMLIRTCVSDRLRAMQNRAAGMVHREGDDWKRVPSDRELGVTANGKENAMR